MIRTVYEVRETDPSLALCVGTTAVNTYLSLVKDRALAQIFGASAAAAKGVVPFTAYGCWMGRDAVTMGMVFTAPPKVSKMLQTNLGWSPSSADVSATLAIPVLIQPLTTAMHLMGIDLVNRPSSLTLSSRLGVVGKSYGESLVARTGRIFVPYRYARSRPERCCCCSIAPPSQLTPPHSEPNPSRKNTQRGKPGEHEDAQLPTHGECELADAAARHAQHAAAVDGQVSVACELVRSVRHGPHVHI